MGPHWKPSPATSLQLHLEVLLFLSQAGQLKAKWKASRIPKWSEDKACMLPSSQLFLEGGKRWPGREHTPENLAESRGHSMGVTCLAFLLSWTSSVNQKPASTSPCPAPPHPSPSPASGLSFACCRPTSLGSVCLKLFLQRSLKCPQESPNPPQGPHCAFGRKALPLVLWANFLSSLDAEPPRRGDTRGIPVLGQGWSQVTCAFSMKYTLGFPDSL